MVIHFYRDHIEHIVGYSGSTKFGGGYHRYLIGECQEYKMFCNNLMDFPASESPNRQSHGKNPIIIMIYKRLLLHNK